MPVQGGGTGAAEGGPDRGRVQCRQLHLVNVVLAAVLLEAAQRACYDAIKTMSDTMRKDLGSSRSAQQ